MKLVSERATESAEQAGVVETVVIPQAHLDYLGRVSREMNPEMPPAFGNAHVVRTLIERLEKAHASGTVTTRRRQR